MPQPLNRVPAGLLSFFQTKGNGQNPALFEDIVRPSIDLLDFYASSIGLRVEENFETGFDPADLNTTIAPVTVPGNEMWLVKNVTSTGLVTTSGAGESWNFACVLQRVAATEVLTLAENPPQSNFSTWAAVVGFVNAAHLTFNTPFFIPPGSQVATTGRQFAGGAARYTVGTRVLYYPVEI